MDQEKPNYYAIIPANVRYDESLTSNEKLLYGEISSLTQKNGECWASNNYFSNLYKISNQSISRCIRHLKEKGYIELKIIYKENSKEIEKRIISIPINNNVNTYYQKCEYPINNNVKENNTSINNKEINNINIIYKEKKFKKPTLEDVNKYCLEINSNIDSQYFIDYYESNGWKVGKNSMKDWKAAVRNWGRKQKEKEPKKVVNNSDLGGTMTYEELKAKGWL